jgi:hypothetical protein
MPKTDKPGHAKIYLFNRIPGHDLKEIRKRGIKIVCDIDDYWELYQHHYLYNHFKFGGMTKRIIESLKMSDVVLTTHSMLADRVKEHNKNVYLVPNAIPYDKEQFNIGKQEYTGKTAFIGGMSHYKDINLIKGYSVPNQLHISRYMDHYKGVNICLAPLENNEFNQCKSNLKTLEAACGHAAVICSDMHPFRNGKDDEYVIYAKNNEWESKIKYCKDNPNYTIDIGEKLAEHCRKHYDLIKVNETRKDIFSELLRQG